MNVLVLNGSPRKSGSVAALLRGVTQKLPAGHAVEWVDVGELAMRFCDGCMTCRTSGTCALPEDDAHRVGRKIRDADALVVGTPTHWGNMSAPLKLLFDRNVAAFVRPAPRGTSLPLRKGRPAVIVAACGTPWPASFVFPESRGAVNAVRTVLLAGGFRVVGTLVKPGSLDTPALSPRLLAQAGKIGDRLAREAGRS